MISSGCVASLNDPAASPLASRCRSSPVLPPVCPVPFATKCTLLATLIALCALASTRVGGRPASGPDVAGPTDPVGAAEGPGETPGDAAADDDTAGDDNADHDTADDDTADDDTADDELHAASRTAAASPAVTPVTLRRRCDDMVRP